MKYLVFVIVLIFTVRLDYSQYQIEWVRTMNGPSNGFDRIIDMCPDNMNNIYVTGYSSTNSSYTDIMTIKYDSQGNLIWNRIFNSPSNSDDQANAIAVDDSGNVYVAGFSYVNNEGENFLIIKYNSSGDQLWFKYFNGSANWVDRIEEIALDHSGFIYVTGYSKWTGTGIDILTIKYNSAGSLIWMQRRSGYLDGEDIAVSIQVDNFENVYVAGSSFLFNGVTVTHDITTIKYDSSGIEQWVRYYNSPIRGTDKAIGLDIDHNGNIYVGGNSSTDPNGNYYDYVVIKYLPNGTQQWLSKYVAPVNNDGRIYDFDVDSVGNSCFTGNIFNGSVNNYDMITVRYNQNGIQTWANTFNGQSSLYDHSFDVEFDRMGNIYVAGTTENTNSLSDITAIKYDSQGLLKWVFTYNGTANYFDEGTAIYPDNFNNVYISGSSYNTGLFYDYAAIKLSQPINISPISTEVPQKFSLSQNYPNPFNPATNINFQLPKSNHVKLSVYDLLGREVEVLVNEELSPGEYKVDFDGANYPSGIYYYRLQAGDFAETKKMILVK